MAICEMRFAIACTLAAAIGAVAIVEAGGADASPASAPATSPATAPASAPAGLSVGPLFYYRDKCARCHGAYAGGYLPESVAKYEGDDAALRKIIAEMAAGPAMAPLAEPDLDAQVAFHRSAFAQLPFIAITKREGNSISGEATPGSELRLMAGERTLPIALEGHSWSISTKGIDAASLAEARVMATKNGKEASLAITELHTRPQ